MSWQQTPTVPTRRPVSVPAIVAVGLGVVAIALWLFVLDFAGTSDVGTFSFADIRKSADLFGVNGLPGAWYQWIAYLSAALAIVLALLTLIPAPAQDGLRVASVVVAAAGIVIAFVALADGQRGIEIGDRRVGFWVGMAGFVLLAVGSTLRAARSASPVAAVGPAPAAWGTQQPVAGATWDTQPPAPGATWGAQQPADLWAATAPAYPAVAPGWHADPTGRNQQRWWDGQAWTPHVVRAGVQTTDPL
ncbi:MAG: DUF2510 domain-containing protein [Ilumatobacteraceae bacterium]